MSVASGPKPAGRAGGMAAVSLPGKKAVAYVVKGLAAALGLGAVFYAGAMVDSAPAHRGPLRLPENSSAQRRLTQGGRTGSPVLSTFVALRFERARRPVRRPQEG